MGRETMGDALTDFLLARIAEDEERMAGCVDGCSPKRVLAECEAKRRIVEHCDASSHCGSYVPPGPEREAWLSETEKTYGFRPPLHYPDEYAAGCDGCSSAESVTQNDGWILRYLALPYADHPDYRSEWRP